MSVLFKKILLPLDGSETAAQAIPYAEELASLSDATLILFQVAPDRPEELRLTGELKIERPADRERLAAVDHATRVLQRFADGLTMRKIASQVVIEVGDAAPKILDYATHNAIDLIVMSTHGRSALARWVYGSVANKVLSNAHCPVFLVRSTFHEHTAAPISR